jgi:hypothetical protein
VSGRSKIEQWKCYASAWLHTSNPGFEESIQIISACTILWRRKQNCDLEKVSEQHRSIFCVDCTYLEVDQRRNLRSVTVAKNRAH